jgi:hypothetical protein
MLVGGGDFILFFLFTRFRLVLSTFSFAIMLFFAIRYDDSEIKVKMLSLMRIIFLNGKKCVISWL